MDQVDHSLETCGEIGDKYCSADGFCECKVPGYVMDPVNNNDCCKLNSIQLEKKLLNYWILNIYFFKLILALECFDYSTSFTQLSWTQANDKCELLGGKLASARDLFHWDYLENIVLSLGDDLHVII